MKTKLRIAKVSYSRVASVKTRKISTLIIKIIEVEKYEFQWL